MLLAVVLAACTGLTAPLPTQAPTPTVSVTPNTPDAEGSAATFLDAWFPFVGDFLTTAFEVEMMDAVEREDSLFNGLEIPPRKVPVAGA